MFKTELKLLIKHLENNLSDLLLVASKNFRHISPTYLSKTQNAFATNHSIRNL